MTLTVKRGAFMGLSVVANLTVALVHMIALPILFASVVVLAGCEWLEGWFKGTIASLCNKVILS